MMKFFRSQPKPLILFLIFCFFAGVSVFSVHAGERSRFFFDGNGNLNIEGGGKRTENLTPRLLALLDYLQDRLTGGLGRITLYSGYRSPAYNKSLRDKGKSAAKASLHMEGMAADFALSGVKAAELWKIIRSLNCCGAGFYNGLSVHVDTGPVRFWEQETSKVFTDISDNNKRLYITTQYDIYYPGEKAVLKVVRGTLYPFGVSEKVEIMKGKEIWQKVNLEGEGKCRMIQSREKAVFHLVLPDKKEPAGERLHLRMRACSKPAKEMLDLIDSNSFIIASPD